MPSHFQICGQHYSTEEAAAVLADSDGDDRVKAGIRANERLIEKIEAAGLLPVCGVTEGDEPGELTSSDDSESGPEDDSSGHQPLDEDPDPNENGGEDEDEEG